MFLRNGQGIQLFGDGLKVRNDCKAGKWKLGDDNFLKGDLDMIILQVDRFRGSIADGPIHSWLRLWFLVASTSTVNLPKKVVCSTLIKTTSLENLTNLFMLNLDRGEPFVIQPRFISKATTKNGQAVNYYILDFDSRNLTEDEIDLMIEVDEFMKGKLLIDTSSPIQEFVEASSNFALIDESNSNTKLLT